MNEREQIIQLWFKMWLTQQDLGMDDIFAEDVMVNSNPRIPFVTQDSHFVNENPVL